MAETKIEWADVVWNPVTGCTAVSEGCANCYARRMAMRLRGRFGYPADKPFQVTIHTEKLDDPVNWRKPRRVFVCSMGDLFHENVKNEYIDSVLEVIRACKQHTFMVLTKRPHNFYGSDIENLWLGVSVENENNLWRIDELLRIPAAKRFVSIEPMLAAVDLDGPGFLRVNGCHTFASGDAYPYMCLNGRIPGDPPCKGSPRLDWVIVGGESGPWARPMHPQWVRDVRDQCVAAGVPFFFKGWGEWQHDSQGADTRGPINSSWDMRFSKKGWRWEDKSWSIRVGKKTSGRLIDGREWNQIPEI